MRHYQEKVVHMLLLVVRFVVFDADDYFALVVFQMAWPTLYVAWHAIIFIGDCDIHVQISTYLD
jgi:NAD/NADP transhydrogenase beta subunit